MFKNLRNVWQFGVYVGMVPVGSLFYTDPVGNFILGYGSSWVDHKAVGQVGSGVVGVQTPQKFRLGVRHPKSLVYLVTCY